MKNWRLGETECEWIDERWIEELLWCPSQCYRRIKCNGKVYTLYLRWRWEDPWQFKVAEGDMLASSLLVLDLRTGEAGALKDIDKKGNFIIEPLKWRFVTDDLFEKYGCFFIMDEYKEAEKKAEELFFKWLKEASKSEREGN